MRIRFHSLWVNRRDALDGWEPKRSVTTSPSSRIAATTTLARHHAVCRTVSNRCDRGNHSFGKLIELFLTNVKDAFAATQPKVVLTVFQNAVDNIIKQTIAGGVCRKLAIFHSIQTATICTNPQGAVRIFME